MFRAVFIRILTIAALAAGLNARAQTAELQRKFAANEPIVYAEELAPGVVLGMTPFRLTILRPGIDADEHLASYGITSRYPRYFRRHKNAIYLSQSYGAMQILRLGDDNASLKFHESIRLGSGRSTSPEITGEKMVVLVENTLKVYSLANPLLPAVVGSLVLPSKTVRAIAADGNRVVCSGDQNVYVVDIAATPKIVGRFKATNVSDGTIGTVAIAGDYAYSFGSQKIIAYDISTPAEIKHVGSYPAGLRYQYTVPRKGGLLACYRYSGRMVTIGEKGAITVDKDWQSTMPVRLQDPAARPDWLEPFSKRWRKGSVRYLTGEGDTLYVASSSYVTAYNLDGSGKAKHIGQGKLQSRSYSRVTVKDGVYYSNRGILDMRTPSAPKPYDLAIAEDLAVDGDRAYIAYGSKISVWDISDPSAAKELGDIKLGWKADRITVRDGLLYAVGRGGLQISKVDGVKLTEVGKFKAGEKWRIFDLLIVDDILYVGDSEEGVAAFDISDPANPEIYSQVRVRGTPYRLQAIGGVVYAGCGGSGGLQVLDLRPPGLGKVIASKTDMQYSYSMYLHRGHVYLNHSDAGFCSYESATLAGLQKDAAERQPLEAKLKTAPDDLATLTALAVMCDRQGYTPRAQVLYRQLLKLAPEGEHVAKANAFKARVEADAAASAKRRDFLKNAAKQDLASIEYGSNGDPVEMRIRSPRAFSEYGDVIAGLTSLVELSCASVGLKDDYVAIIGKLTALRRLSLYNTKITDEALVHLKGLPHLQELNLEECTKLTNAGIAHLADHKKLVELNLESTGVSDAGLKHLAGMTAMVEMNLSETQISGEGLVHLKDMQQLNELDISECPLAGGLDGLAPVPLVTLDASECGIQDVHVAQIAKISSLQRLRVHDTQMTDSGLKSLSVLKNLEYITLWDTLVSDKGTVHLKAMQNLETVVMGSTGITDATLKVVATLPKLSTLNVDNTQVTDEGLAALHGMTSLSYLSIDETKVTDAGLIALGKIPSLTTVSAEGTSISGIGIAGLRKTLPSVKVSSDIPSASKGEGSKRPVFVMPNPEEAFKKAAASLAGKKQVVLTSGNISYVNDEGQLAYLEKRTGALRPSLINSPDGGPVAATSLVVVGGAAFAGTANGLFRSGFNGQFWSSVAINNTILGTPVHELAEGDNGVLTVTFGEAKRSAAFNVAAGNWLTDGQQIDTAAPAASAAIQPSAGVVAELGAPDFMPVLSVGIAVGTALAVIMLFGVVRLRTQGK
jgi:Leucine-rich repeat (LRR) protein